MSSTNLSTRDIAQLCSKAFGIYALLFALGALQYLVLFIFQGSPQASWLYITGVFLPSILLLILAAVLWLKADTLSSLMVTDAREVNGATGLTALEIKKIAYFVLGLFILANTIPQLTGIFFLLTPQNPQPETSRFLLEKIVEVLVRAAIGFGLLLVGRFGVR
jgi:hypothetical protein